MMREKARRTNLILAVLVLATVLFALLYGSYDISFTEVMKTLATGGDASQHLAIWGIRLPRALVAAFVGAALATSGCIMQSVTHNPLAEPGLLGINSGATMLIVLYISLNTTDYTSVLGNNQVLTIPFVAIVGAFLAAGMILLIARRKGKISNNRMVLVGVGINIAFSSVTTLLQLAMSQGNYNRALTWTSGSLWGAGFLYFWMVAPLCLAVILFLLYKGKTLDVLGLGDNIATGLGVDVAKERKILLFFAVLLAAAATAVAGNISFVGLLGPHIAERIVGPVHRRKIVASALISAILIIVADTLARNLFSPLEIPVGILLSIIGVPYFIYLMLKTK